MDVNITGKGIELGEALQTHVQDRISSGVHKYFDRPAEAQVTFARDGSSIRCEATAHLASGVFLNAQGDAHDAYGAFDDALEKLEKRVRRYKRRLKDHHANGKEALPAETTPSYILQPLEADEDEDDVGHDGADPHPIIIAESTTELRTMTVGTAVLQLDISDQPVIVFKNAANNRISVVYRRPDNNIGWIDTGKDEA
ncbi:ribosome hibernation-promoting factor, HPF/YfiA family [Aquisalinus flavus]|uniref:Ribosome hibernation promoting factor n=1 Tax=Aquisalinus flavus TaxID=1526572 RepID=A0A8J2V4U2_9PROT|nr:ribosome-associated translation inhibitor RaiA [Aquisalinus flavus]MBD0425810.1 ribosome-associated translation inhibitor RaiA [Aquisalinus flavus]UNE48584.1 ribosome-associated translation inhibitor RaiA [Aquisalinus flavus]GGD13054.1 ribosomal subunit interface protein [Aquisalinus flavus]